MNGVIYGNITNMTPLYNFIDDSYFAKMPVLRHLSQRLILSGFRLSPRKWQKIPGYEFLCSCAPCNCIKVRMFSAHSNLFLYSICMNKEKVGYIETTHCQSGSMVLFPAMRRKSAAVPKIWCRKRVF